MLLTTTALDEWTLRGIVYCGGCGDLMDGLTRGGTRTRVYACLRGCCRGGTVASVLELMVLTDARRHSPELIEGVPERCHSQVFADLYRAIVIHAGHRGVDILPR
ncbi:hypothetical protein [Longispora albida]|uniref:hypothetical protein n=1 Tax=Longispora albida TaxID=203523 RepID=UPI00036C1DB7|nr:hypothetical protein [Longispora albida]